MTAVLESTELTGRTGLLATLVADPLRPRPAGGVSARCLYGRHQLSRRMRRALRTLQVNGADQRPWQRWAARFSG